MHNQKKLKEIAFELLKEIGENPNRTGLKDTPKRMAKMWTEIFKGYDKQQIPNVTVFNNGNDGIIYDEMITDTGDFYSHCEHHTATFFGKYYFAYIPHPKGKLLGLSKVAREGYRDAQDSLASAQKLRQMSAALSAEGLTIPQFRAMTSEQLGALSPQTISNLEDAGLLRLPETMTVTDLPAVTYGPSSLSSLQTYQIPEEYKQGPQQYAKGTAMNYNVPEAPQYSYDKTTGQFTEIQKVATPNIFQKGFGTLAKGYDWAVTQYTNFPIPKIPIYQQIDKAKAGDLLGALYPVPEFSTVGQESQKFREGLSRGRELFSQAVTAGLNLLPGEQKYSETYPERNVPIYKDETGIYNPTTGVYESPSYYTLPSETKLTALGYIPAVAGIAPEIAGYVAASGLMLGTDIAVAGQNIKDVEKVVDKEMQKQFQNLDIVNIPEGYRNPTWEEFNTEENRAALRNDLIKQYKTQSYVAGAFLAAGGAVKAYQKLTEPIISYKRFNPYSKVREIGWGDKGQYKILTVQRLPEVRVTNRFREFFGMKPKVDWTPVGRASPKWVDYPSRVYQTQPALGRAVNKNKPYFAETKYLGKGPTERAYSIIVPKGASSDIKEILRQLPKAERRVAFQALKEGRLYPSTKLSTSNLDVINIKKIGTGRAKTSFFTFNRMDVDPFRMSAKGELYKTITTFKDTSKPFYRASGRVPRLRGEMIVLNEAPVNMGPTGITFTEIGKGGKEFFNPSVKTPLSSTFSLTKQVTKQSLKYVPVPKAIFIPPKVSTAYATKSITKAATRTASVLDITTKSATALSPLIKVNTKSLDASLIALTPKEIIKEVPVQKEIPKTIVKERAIVKSVEVPKQAITPITIPIIKEIVIPKSTVKIGIITITTPRVTTPTFPRPRVPKIPPIIPNLEFVEDTRKRRTGGSLFIPEVRRKGKFQAVSRPTSLWGAVETGKRKVRETLGASLRVKEARTGRIVPLEPFGIFAPSKREAGVLVQVRGARLMSKTERKEIQAARRSAKWWK